MVFPQFGLGVCSVSCWDVVVDVKSMGDGGVVGVLLSRPPCFPSKKEKDKKDPPPHVRHHSVVVVVVVSTDNNDQSHRCLYCYYD